MAKPVGILDLLMPIKCICAIQLIHANQFDENLNATNLARHIAYTGEILMKVNLRKFPASTFLFAIVLICQAGDFSISAVPTRIDTTAYGGFMVYGAFGNPAGCTRSDTFFVKDTHPQFKMIYAMVMTAIATNQRIYAYAHTCEPVLWYDYSNVTFNNITVGSVSILR
jgi:hypothetical protein